MSMKKILALFFALMVPASVMALTQSASPPKFPIPWGNSAGGSFIRAIPTTSQIGINNGWASLTDGFPPLNFTPIAAGGIPPFGQDMNGILKQTTQGVQWQQAGGPLFWDTAIATGAGGYPKGARINSAVTPGTVWYNTVDSNAVNPDIGGSGVGGWVQDPGQVQTGTPSPYLFAAAPTGYVAANGLTIGNSSSNATNRANADTQFLFSFLWAACPNTICPIYTSGGSASIRGASAEADFAANKAIATFIMNGRGVIGIDTSTSNFLSGVPVQIGSTKTPGSTVGANTQSLAAGSIPAITSSASNSITVSGTVTSTNSNIIQGGIFVAQSGTSSNFFAFPTNGSIAASVTSTGSMSGSNTISVTSNNTGSTPISNAELNTTVQWNLKL
jgi:hypothetical protein